MVTKFRQFQQKKHVMLEIQVLAWDRHKNMPGLNQLMA